MKDNQKANIYIDGANIFYAQRHIGWFIDWKKLIQYTKNTYEIINVKYYTGIRDNDEKMKSFLRYLDAINIEPITKVLKSIKEKKKIIYKSNFDVEMTMDILLERQSYDVCILFSGDSDFHALVKKLHDYGKSVIVWSTRKMISWELKLEADKYIFIEDLKDKIDRSKKPPPLQAE